MIWFIFDLGIGLATFVALAAAFFGRPGRGCGLATEFGARSLQLRANSLPGRMAGTRFPLLAVSEI